jgi:hypothetical protein
MSVKKDAVRMRMRMEASGSACTLVTRVGRATSPSVSFESSTARGLTGCPESGPVRAIHSASWCRFHGFRRIFLRVRMGHAGVVKNNPHTQSDTSAVVQNTPYDTCMHTVTLTPESGRATEHLGREHNDSWLCSFPESPAAPATSSMAVPPCLQQGQGEGRADALTRCTVSAKRSILPGARNAQCTGRREKREREKNRERPVAEHSLQRAGAGPHARGVEKGQMHR